MENVIIVNICWKASFYFICNELAEQHRNRVVETVKFAGIKKSCIECRRNVFDHFRNHLDIHLQCNLCCFQLATLEDITFWGKVCNICGKVFASESPKKINWHKKIHTDSEEFECIVCKEIFKRKFTLKRHLHEEHEKLNIMDSNESNILNHFETINEGNQTKSNAAEKDETSFTCLECNKEFRLQRYLERHVELIHRRSDSGNVINVKCKKDFKFHQLNVHMKNQSDTYIFLQEKHTEHCCKMCDKKFNRKDYLKKHEQTHETSKPVFCCEICEQTFTRKYSLKLHLKRFHTSKKIVFSCNICEKEFNIKSNMIRHKKTFNHM